MYRSASPLRPRVIVAALLVTGLVAAGGRVAHANDELANQELFEQRIRPVLVEHCYECHNSDDMQEGGLAVDHRAPLRSGGDSGAAVVPGEPGESLLLAVLRHEIPGLEMPEGGDKLSDAVISDFERWIADGAADPRSQPPGKEELDEALSWDKVFAKRAAWWSFQPLRDTTPPDVGVHSSSHPIDRFVRARLKRKGLAPSEPAAPEVLVRRIYFALSGLPPTRQQAALWTARLRESRGEERQRHWEALVDSLLESPRFGERWARHWMDWIRYAESHGSEGDPEITEAWRYRDYLIRALNADVPYDQLVREHIAGDLLASPRLSPDGRTNESAIGTAHWRMVFHGFAPTDALDERVRFTDDQINTFSKAFLGLTVSCARCHDHKFDAISQRDYYALYGVFASCRPGRELIEATDIEAAAAEGLRSAADEVSRRLGQRWQALSVERTRDWLNRIAADSAELPEVGLREPLRRLARAAVVNDRLQPTWSELKQAEQKRREAWRELARTAGVVRWDLRNPRDYAQWYRHGNGLPDVPQAAGLMSLAPAGERVVRGLYPAGVYSHALSDKRAARLTSPDVSLDQEMRMWVRARGAGQASLRYVVHDYPRRGTVYPVQRLNDRWQWRRMNLSYWQGDVVHVELSTALDAPLLTSDQPRSWFGVQEVWLVPATVKFPGGENLALRALLDSPGQSSGDPPASLDQLAARLSGAIARAVADLGGGEASDAQAELIDQCVQLGLLSDRVSETAELRSAVERYRALEAEVPVPRRVPGLDETPAVDQPLYVRGDHRQPSDPVPRGFLSVFDTTPYDADRSGRLQLAEDLLDSHTPLTRRVIVNRLWHHLLGAGLVRTPDNFGRLGETPTHPALLDWLALRLEESGWSLKSLIRSIVTSQTWQQTSRPSAEAQRTDPENRWLSHANLRRLEAEAIRDAMLQLSGELDLTTGGAPVAPEAPQRSVYVRVRRNALPPLLRVFDFPEPFSCVGRRDITNVPAQSLAMMNGKLARRTARQWAGQPLPKAAQTTQQRLDWMFQQCFSRSAQPAEIEALEEHYRGALRRLESIRADWASRRDELRQLDAEIATRLRPIRARLLKELTGAEEEDQETVGAVRLPEPVAAWDFERPLDAPGQTPLELRDGAEVRQGQLRLAGGYAISRPLETRLLEKTLSAWVQLDTLEQRGGGVLSVQTPSGAAFDAIVFGEQQPRHWLAGSNFFRRTKPFAGPAESQAVRSPVHVAIVYAADGTITAYRNGKPYGQPYRSAGPRPFEAGETVVTLGVRHLPAGGNRLLRGAVLAVRVYDRALDAAQVAAEHHGSPLGLTRERLLAAMEADERARVRTLITRRETLAARVERLREELPEGEPTAAAWREVAHTLLMTKEFMYVR